MPKLRIFLADDHAVVRTGLRAMIDGESDMEVIGEAPDGLEAVQQIPLLKPDIAVLDVSMPELTGPAVTSRVKEAVPQMKIIALTVHEDRNHITELFAAGATGYLLKRAAATELISAIRAVASGGVYIDPRIAGKLVEKPNDISDPTTVALSRRETEVLRLLAQGHSHKDISTQLAVSLKTIETYKARSMEKLGLRTRVDLIRHAVNSGWLSP